LGARKNCDLGSKNVHFGPICITFVYACKLNFNKCFILTGVPELGISPFDPFFATEVKQSNRAGLLGYRLTIHNVTESGWRISEIRKVK